MALLGFKTYEKIICELKSNLILKFRLKIVILPGHLTDYLTYSIIKIIFFQAIS